MKDSSASMKPGRRSHGRGGVRGFLMDHDEFQSHPLTPESGKLVGMSGKTTELSEL